MVSPGAGGSPYRTAVPAVPGLVGTATLTVGKADTATALGSGDVPLLGTPRLVALAEEATCQALVGRLDPATTSVGMRVQLDHLTPVPVGAEVTAEATLEKVEGRRLTFAVTISSEACLVAAGRITRVVVERERFLERADSAAS